MRMPRHSHMTSDLSESHASFLVHSVHCLKRGRNRQKVNGLVRLGRREGGEDNVEALTERSPVYHNMTHYHRGCRLKKEANFRTVGSFTHPPHGGVRKKPASVTKATTPKLRSSQGAV